jgi:predicted nucleic acid-binding protein
MVSLAQAAVIDSSALLELILPNRKNEPLEARLAKTGTAVAPDFVDLEVLHVLRREVRRGDLSEAQAETAIKRLVNLPVFRTPCQSLVKRIWSLRHSISAYDGSYVALAEQMDVPLLTCDARLANAHGHSAKIDLYERVS